MRNNQNVRRIIIKERMNKIKRKIGQEKNQKKTASEFPTKLKQTWNCHSKIIIIKNCIAEVL